MNFSVLMSVYHKEKSDRLDVALGSIVSQTLQPNEVIIVKDGLLTEALDLIIDKYIKQYDYFKVVVLEKNSGLGIALNEGLKHCSYEIVARADSDDLSLPERFESQIQYLIQHPEVDIVGSNIIEFDEQLENQQSMRILPESDSHIKAYIKKRCPFNHMSVMYKKNVIEEAGSYEDCLYFEDYYLWCKVFLNGGTFHNLQRSLVHARGGPSMIARRGGKTYLKSIFQFQQKIYRLGVINRRSFVINTFVRCIIAVVPGNVREVFYKKVLRK